MDAAMGKQELSLLPNQPPVVAQKKDKPHIIPVRTPKDASEARQILVGISKSASMVLQDSIRQRKEPGEESTLRTERALDAASYLDSYTEQFISRAPEQIRSEVRKKADLAKEYFLKNDPRQGLTPIETIAGVYDHLAVPTTGAEAELFEPSVREHMHFVMERAFDQHFTNPQEYLSHGFDHTLIVLQNTTDILQTMPEIVDRMTTRYGMSAGEANFMIKQVALLHDIGYVDIYGKDKASHSIFGAEAVSAPPVRELFAKLIKSPTADLTYLLHDFRDAILFHNADTVEHVFTAKIENSHGQYLVEADDIVDVVTTFSSEDEAVQNGTQEMTRVYVADMKKKQELDTQFAQLAAATGSVTPNIEVFVVSDTFRGRTINLLSPKIRSLGLEYSEVDVLQLPMQTIIRIADNMDMQASRFTALQQEPAFQAYVRALGDNGPASTMLHYVEQQKKAATPWTDDAQISLADTVDSNKTMPQHVRDTLKTVTSWSEAERSIKEALLIQALTTHPTSQTMSDTLTSFQGKYDSHSFRHFGGCQPVRSVRLEKQADGSGIQLTIKVDRDQYTELQSLYARESKRDPTGAKIERTVPVASYQIWRTTEAYRSLRVDNEPIAIVVVDEKNQPMENM